MFKTGDKIKLKSDIDKEKYTDSGLGWDERMENLLGKEFEVYKMANWYGIDSVGILDSDGIDWYFFPEDVEFVNDASKIIFENMVNSLMKE